MSDHKRCGLCDKRIRADATCRLLADTQKEFYRRAGLLKCSRPTYCNNKCVTTAHREQQATAAARPKTRSNPASMRQPGYVRN